jgi:AraC-like DNA-binding protein
MKTNGVQDDFFDRLGSHNQLLSLFGLLPDVNFFVKDRRGRFILLNPRGCELCGIESARDAIGKTDADFFPIGRAAEYMADDQRVMKSGQPIFNRVESAPSMEGSPHLVVTNKIPLHDKNGRIIGVAGISRHVAQVRSAPAAQRRLAKSVAHLHEHHRTALKTEALASIAALSVSQYERIFKKTFGTSPRQYLQRVRVESASRLLAETDDTVAAIGVECGFYDHAHFTKAFTKIAGLSPSRYRSERQSPQLRPVQGIKRKPRS